MNIKYLVDRILVPRNIRLRRVNAFTAKYIYIYFFSKSVQRLRRATRQRSRPNWSVRTRVARAWHIIRCQRHPELGTVVNLFPRNYVLESVLVETMLFSVHYLQKNKIFRYPTTFSISQSKKHHFAPSARWMSVDHLLKLPNSLLRIRDIFFITYISYK